MKDSRLTTTASNIEIVGGAPPNVFIDPLPKAKVLDSMKDVYMEKLGGERYQAAMFKHNDMLIDDKEKK
eukprot:g6237.t1